MCGGPRPPGALRARRRAAAAGALALAAAFGMSGGASAATFSPAAADPPGWTVYHGNPAGTGVAPSVTAVNTGTRAWTSPALDGDIYGEPLVYAGRVYAATENDTVYALSAATGRLVWSRHLGRPVPAGSLPCGNISPIVGITGTPVIDRSRREIFVVADELLRGRPAHIMAGLATASGRVEMTRDVDLAGTNPAAQLQRTGLTLDAGRVVFGMGGNYGDCGNYRGKVEAIPESAGGQPEAFVVDSAHGESQGSVWMGGAAPVVDRQGHVWVTVGNGSVTSFRHAYDFSDSALELSSAMRLLQFFAPSNWASENAGDLDMSTAPALLPDGQVIAAGKDRSAYLLNGARLGGIGHQQATLRQACGDVIDGGFALAGMTAYLPCVSGVIAARATRSPAALRLLWRAGRGGGPPIIAAGLVWTIGQNGMLYGLNPANGRVRQQALIGALVNHFPTPSVGDGVLLAPTARHVVAFRASSHGGIPATPGPASTTAPASKVGQPSPTGGGTSPAVLAGSVIGGLVVVGGGWWLLRRRMAGRRHVRLTSRSTS
jgi:outer membrane protein assembly factor BamB